MRTLVTGGAGFIGSNLVDVARGDEVLVVDDLLDSSSTSAGSAIAPTSRPRWPPSDRAR
jgi:nucleoside-diphosphate-sugar epimerase